MIIEKSSRKDKKYMATFNNGVKIHFGSKNSKTYLDHHDKIKRNNYLARHRVNEDWSNPYTPATLSRFLLWGNSIDLNTNHKAYMKKFNVS